MCLIVFSWQPDSEYPFVVAANRDEFYQRETAPLHLWPDSPVIAGRDLQQGGTWMGITATGRFAAVTNVRRGGENTTDYPISRGQLCRDFLEGEDSPQEYLHKLQNSAMQTGGFNLLVADRHTLGYGCNRFFTDRQPCYRYQTHLPPGCYGLSNHRLETPWPKLVASRTKLAQELQAQSGNTLNEAQLLSVIVHAESVADEALPDTGVGLDKERFLAPAFISSGMDYGTRASTILIRDRNGRQTLMEQTWLAGGKPGRRTTIYR